MKKHKYGAKGKICRQGHKHPSTKESGFCDAYHIDQSEGKLRDLEREIFFPFVIAGIPLKHPNGRRVGYTADFQFIEEKNGFTKKVVVEVKGMKVRDWPLRKAVFEACYPDIELRVV